MIQIHTASCLPQLLTRGPSGLLRLSFFTLFEPPYPLVLANEISDQITVAHETYGVSNAAKDNAIYACHAALTGDAATAGKRTTGRS